MMDQAMDAESLDTQASVLKKLIKELMLLPDAKKGDAAMKEGEETVALDGDAAGEGEGEQDAEVVEAEVVVEDKPEADETDIANYKRA